MPNPPPSLHILCFGDSLTEGYSMYGMQWTPYSETTKEVLEERLSDKWSFDIDTDGVSGQLVTAGFKKRMEALYTNPKTPSRPYDWVVFLGGTNDLAYSIPPSKIYDEIKAITAMPLETGARVLILTVPECGVKNEKLDGRRGELNALIKGDGREGVYALDLHALIPYHSMPEKEREEIWDDGLHFTSAGYERVGVLVAERLIEILGGEKKDSKENVGGGGADEKVRGENETR
ncbi:SGNH hydrolase-type esterase domain-containing protein [Rhexocercosporidium sp. MPI-PUGE-AT-0058]|nr:SGNH hydrolase-type esterase domain-containing protein [Rhexocercosporidium sp. MPI-PUGE-AT-0058]